MSQHWRTQPRDRDGRWAEEGHAEAWVRNGGVSVALRAHERARRALEVDVASPTVMPPSLLGPGGRPKRLKREKVAEIRGRMRTTLPDKNGNPDKIARDIALVAPTEDLAHEIAGDVNAGFLRVEHPGSPETRQHLADYAALPPSVRHRLRQQNTKVFIGTKSVPAMDHQEFLSGVQPRGWPPGSTWDEVVGAYNPMMNTVVAGGGKPHGSVSLLAHEVGHALDMDGRISGTDEFKEHHRRLMARGLPGYYSQDGPGSEAGCSETWAEACAIVLANEYRAREFFDGPFVEYVKNQLGVTR